MDTTEAQAHTFITTRVWGDWAGGMHLSDAGKETEYVEGERTQIPRAVPARALEIIRTWISLKHSAGRDAQELTDLQSCLTSLEAWEKFKDRKRKKYCPSFQLPAVVL